MPGKNYKQGYVCAECLNSIGVKEDIRTPLYKREHQRYIFSGLVICPVHGVQKGVRKNDGDR
jgi:hypothetical protein